MFSGSRALAASAVLGGVCVGAGNVEAQTTFPSAAVFLPTAEQQIVMNQAEPSDETTQCLDAIKILNIAAVRHFRGVRTDREMVIRLRHAALSLAKDLGQPIKFKRAPAFLNGTNYQIDCSLPTDISKAFNNRISTRDVWSAWLNHFLLELDPNSHLFMGNQAKGRDFSNEKIGIGVVLERDSEGNVVVVGVARGSGAERAGIEIGDRLTDFKTKSNTQVDEAISGPEGTVLTLNVLKTSGKSVNVKARCQKFEVQYAMARDVNDHILHIRLTQFGKKGAAQVASFIAERPGVKGILLDLRFNPGGLLSEARDLVDLFIDSGLVVSVWGRDARVSPPQAVFALTRGEATTAALVILVNDGSASASEVVAQSLSGVDYGRAVIMGRRTYGKGSVNVIHQIKEDVIMWLTEALYFTLTGFSPHSVGVSPNIPTPDPLIARVLAERQMRIARGEKLAPWRQEDQPYNIPNPGKLPTEITSQFTQGVSINRIGDVVAMLPKSVQTTPTGEIGDPGAEMAVGVLEEMSRICPTYRVEGCHVPVALQAQNFIYKKDESRR